VLGGAADAVNNSEPERKRNEVRPWKKKICPGNHERDLVVLPGMGLGVSRGGLPGGRLGSQIRTSVASCRLQREVCGQKKTGARQRNRQAKKKGKRAKGKHCATTNARREVDSGPWAKPTQFQNYGGKLVRRANDLAPARRPTRRSQPSLPFLRMKGGKEKTPNKKEKTPSGKKLGTLVWGGGYLPKFRRRGEVLRDQQEGDRKKGKVGQKNKVRS